MGLLFIRTNGISNKGTEACGKLKIKQTQNFFGLSDIVNLNARYHL